MSQTTTVADLTAGRDIDASAAINNQLYGNSTFLSVEAKHGATAKSRAW